MKHTLPLIALLLVSACAKVTPADGDMQNVKVEIDPNDLRAPDPVDPELGNAMSADGGTPADMLTSGMVPMRFHGRWGMVEADCTSDLGDAKGLLTIDNEGLKFYESRASLLEERPSEDGFSGNFAFTGEGQSWEKVVSLKRENDKLRRSDDEGNYSYTLCA